MGARHRVDVIGQYDEWVVRTLHPIKIDQTRSMSAFVFLPFLLLFLTAKEISPSDGVVH